ncbi:unnamed protein product [Phytophthora lilii]|uniref:Unnamed protein product n=1 Tax=Phytophthora lilii TaxID=2077276 RepID=A0A9W6TZH9_9STRA|nr:unnamed protein product [Phytophthora lilii]
MEGYVRYPPSAPQFNDNVVGSVMQRLRPTPGYLAAADTGESMGTQYSFQHLRQELWSFSTRNQGELIARSRNELGETHQEDTTPPPGETMSSSGRTGKAQQWSGSRRPLLADAEDRATRSFMKETKATHETMSDPALAEKLRLRELRRLRQIRYRKKKDNCMHSLEGETAQLMREIEQLEQRRRSVTSSIPEEKSVWNVAVEYFRFFRYGLPPSPQSQSPSRPHSSVHLHFLRATMTQDVVFNAERGVEAVMRTWIIFRVGLHTLRWNLSA